MGVRFPSGAQVNKNRETLSIVVRRPTESLQLQIIIDGVTTSCTNNYNCVMKKFLLFLPVLLIVVFLLRPTTKVAEVVVKPSPTPYAFSENKLWSLIQNWRKSQGLSPYIKDQRLCAIAKDRVTNDPPLDDHAGLYRKYSNYPYVIQENLAEYQNEQQMFNEWITSPFGHRETLEKPYSYSCIVCIPVKNTDRTYCSQIFSNF